MCWNCFQKNVQHHLCRSKKQRALRSKSVTPYILVLACITAGLIVVPFLPENIVLLFSIIFLTFNSWSFWCTDTFISKRTALPILPSAALSSVYDATASPPSSALQSAKIISTVRLNMNMPVHYFFFLIL